MVDPLTMTQKKREYAEKRKNMKESKGTKDNCARGIIEREVTEHE